MVGIRRISENLSVGVLDLSAFSKTYPCTGKRETERAGTRHLLQKMLGEEVKISYTAENKPYLEGRKEHISISHSHDKLAISLNNSECTGIDIELLRDKVKNVAHKFLSPAEAEFAGEDVEKLILIWAAKEALYKAASRKGIDFKTQLEVEETAPHLLKGKIRLNGWSKEYILFHKRVEEYMLVFTLNEI